MSVPVMWLTIRQVLGQRRTIVLFIAALIPVGVALIYYFAASEAGRADDTGTPIVANLTVATLLPLCGLIFGTAVIGAEIEDSTIVYLLATPNSRGSILVAKLAIAWLATLAFMVPAVAISGFLAIETDTAAVTLAFVVAAAVGGLVYNAVFVALSVATGRALIIGLVYVFLWEQIVTRLFTGTRFLSIREYTAGIAEALSDPQGLTRDAHLSGPQAFILAGGVIVVATILATRRLQRFEIGEPG